MGRMVENCRFIDIIQDRVKISMNESWVESHSTHYKLRVKEDEETTRKDTQLHISPHAEDKV